MGRTGRSKPRRERLWRLPPDGFRELRLSCLLSRKACAEYLGVSLRTVRYWDDGQHQVPWSVVRLLRLMRQGDLGALHPHWAGWRIVRDTLVAPDGRLFGEDGLRRWYVTLMEARCFRESYDRRHPVHGCQPSATVGLPAAAQTVTLQPMERQGGALRAALGGDPSGTAAPMTAFADGRSRQGGVGRGKAVSGVVVQRTHGREAARSAAGLVNLSTSGTPARHTRLYQRFRRLRRAG